MTGITAQAETKNLDFGDYCKIEQKRYGSENEQYEYKVIQRVNSNCYVDVPIDSANNGTSEVIHKEIVPCLRVVCCGVCEDRVYKVAVKDVSRMKVLFMSNEYASKLPMSKDLVNFPFDQKKNTYNKNGHLENMEVWDWVIDKGGKIWQITSDDMSDLHYQDIARYAAIEEVINDFNK